jgi:hypothetical protein
MAVGIAKDRPHARIDFISAVEKIANEWGLSLYVSDPRPGRVRGEWFELSQGNMANFRRRRDDHFDGVTDDPVSRVVLLTVLGPARPGSSLAVASKLLEQGVGVNAASISALSEIAMINLLVPVGPSVADAFSNSAGGGVNSAERGIRQLRGLCGLINPMRDEELANIDTNLLSGYQMLRSEVFDARAYSPAPSYYPLWVAWDLPSPIVDLNRISALLLECLEQHVEAAEVAYARARLTPEGHMRGRSKISVQLKPEARLRITINLRSIAESLEEDATAALSEIFGSPIDVGLRVTSRERWLGRWNLPV